MTQTDINSIIIWGTACCLLVMGIGMHRAWKAGHRKLAMLPLGLLVVGLVAVPFTLGLAGAGSAAVWAGRAFFPITACIGGYFFLKYDGKRAL